MIAPSGTVIVIDEPEIHLHRSIMFKLWDKIEEHCTDKLLIYITHDLDFAASRKGSQKVWVKSYSGKDWNLRILDPNSDIPDNLMFEVLGNRKPVLFVEGERGSYDNQLYPYIYENYNVIPCHGCSKVIEMTKAFNNEKVRNMHNYDIKGLIDRDYLTSEEIEAYKALNIYTLKVAEIENLYLTEDLIKIVANHLALDPDEIFTKVKNFIFDKFKKEQNNQLISICTKEIRHKLQCYNKPQENTPEALENGIKELMNSVNVHEIFNKHERELNKILSDCNYDALLMIYNSKNLYKQVSNIFGLKADEYANLILRLLKTNKKGAVIDALRKYAPVIE